MAKSKMTAKGQTTLPKAVRAALHLKPGDTLRYLILDGEVRILKARPVSELKGMLRRPNQHAVTLDEMEDGISAGAVE
ncbi:type II toxin-antitoxin system PrlF family antitoxin [Roseivivax sp. THAF197b]|uniref:AbrB/MazE/SpoVT family DNA-binding domain-containing protein n=1 Tax=Roseivivax sp. THAF197b TaxID=2588299 RepID=UPI0012697998|nr:type II toxin-antitoxin system PrlF family antitoxin [Roseivivax sp. THAF197b]QFS84800.1 Antitoxin PrlF [Roseivivax sp. THAF197b]